MTKTQSAIVMASSAAAVLVTVNAAAAVDVQTDVTGALGAILLTNVALVVGVIFQAGTSLQRLKNLEEWRGHHERWAAGKLAEMREESVERRDTTERRMAEYQRADVIAVQLKAIDSRLEKIEHKLEIE